MLDARSSMLDAGREMDRMEGNVTNAANVTDQSWAAGSHKDLAVHQLAHAIAVKLHKFSLRLQKYELYETGSQLRRSSKSVSANLVEGSGRRRYKAEFMKSLIYA